MYLLTLQVCNTPVSYLKKIIPIRDIVAGEAQLRSWVSKIKLTFEPNWILSPLGIVNNLLSSKTEFKDSIHSGSISPSQIIHEVTSISRHKNKPSNPRKTVQKCHPLLSQCYLLFFLHYDLQFYEGTPHMLYLLLPIFAFLSQNLQRMYQGFWLQLFSEVFLAFCYPQVTAQYKEVQ